MLTVKVFDGSMCRRHYQNDSDASSGSSGDSGNTLGAEGEGQVPPQTEAEEGDGEQGISKMSNPCDSDGSQKGRSYCSEKLSAEDSLSVDNSVELANLQTLSSNYVLSTQCYLTKAQKVKIDVLIEKIQPKFTVLVVQMKKSNVKRHATLIIHKDYALEHFPCEDTTVILQLPGKNKDWKCTFRIRPSGVSDAGRRNLFLYNFACDNHINEGDICLFQPMTNVKQKRFIVTVHVLHKANIDHSSGGRTDIGSNYGRKRAKMGAVKGKPHTDGKSARH
uniref:B3 domain-containing protein n=1 Tax=Triticum urartu TaxID=4572 RepID=A0A8R7VDZ8_TRIUA